MGLRSRWTLLVVVVTALGVGGSYGITQLPEKLSSASDSPAGPRVPAGSIDSDDDGLPDEVEQSGWVTQDGTVYRTNIAKADTDDDGLTDGDEAGPLVTNSSKGSVYSGFSNPQSPDTDGDELGDADESDLGLDPQNPDVDGDGLSDGQEVQVIGSNPGVVDTDGDGFDDKLEEADSERRGLDPLLVDTKVGALTYSADYAKGALAGDLWREDSLAWLAGNLTSGASSSIPVIGSIIGSLADLRDVIGSAIRADWVGSGFSLVGVVPGGDAVAIPGKAAKFVSRNPALAAATAAIVATSSKVPNAIKIRASKKIWKSWDELVDAGASPEALIRLQKGRTNLDRLADARKRANHVDGPSTKFFKDGPEGEAFIEETYGATTKGVDKQVNISTKGCLAGCDSDIRIIDVLVDGVAHESKVGPVSLTEFTKRQILKDAWLVRNGDIDGVQWHFLASGVSNKVGPTKPLLDFLEENGISYTIHLPAKA